MAKELTTMQLLCFYSFIASVLTLAAPAENPPKVGHCRHGLVIDDDMPCTSNFDCPGLQLCCSTVAGTKACAEPTETKHGKCPLSELINPGLGNCSLDTNCEGNRKCCSLGTNSYICSDPVYMTSKQRSSSNPGRSLFKRATEIECFNPKYGNCPKSGLLNPGRQCYSDGDCPRNQKCCQPDGSTTKRCSDPENSRAGICPTEKEVTAEAFGKLGLCYTDSNCREGKKCCKGEGCDYFCTPSKDDPNAGDDCFQVIEKRGECPLVVNTAAEKCNVTSENPHDMCSGNRLCCLNYQTMTAHCSDPWTSRPGKCPEPWNILTDGAEVCIIDKECTDLNMKCCPFNSCSYYCSATVR